MALHNRRAAGASRTSYTLWRCFGACLRAQAADIAAALKRRHLATHTIQVKVRYGDFTTLTRQLAVEEPSAEARDIYRLG